MADPIKPEDIRETKMPSGVIEAFNELIMKGFNGKSSIVYQNEVIKLIMDNTDITREDIFKMHYLDIEYLYSECWNVKYNKAYIGDDYEPYFKFEIKP